MVTIVQEREKCVGCGACVAICPENWEMADDGKAKCKNKNPKDAGCNKEAEGACPVQCITVK